MRVREKRKKEGRDGQMKAGRKEGAKRSKLCVVFVAFPHFNMVCMHVCLIYIH